MASPGTSHPIPWVQGVHFSSSLGILLEVHHGCVHICPHFLWTFKKYPSLSLSLSFYLSSVPFWINLLTLAHYIILVGDIVDGWRWLFHQHISPVQPLLKHNPFHEITACVGNSISSWLTSFMKAARSFQSLTLVWTSFSYCQKCFIPPHFSFREKKKEKSERFLESPPAHVCKTREWWRTKNLRKVH